MKRIMLQAAIALASYLCCNAVATDSVQVYLYTDSITAGHDGLHWAWQDDAGTWHNDVAWQKLVSSDYDEGWRFARQEGVAMVDEHYYEQPGWFINNRHFYDGYDRRGPRVYLGEYASKSNGLYNGLAEAAYLCDVERFSRLEPTLGIDEQQFSIGAGGETMLPPRSFTVLRYLK